MNLRNIHIGELIKLKVDEYQIQQDRILKFFNCDERELDGMYSVSNMDTNVLLRWCKLLEFDFFRVYSGHLILYAPPTMTKKNNKSKSNELVFRKNVYTEEVKGFILSKIKSQKMTIAEVYLKYRIPKTTLHKWIKKM